MADRLNDTDPQSPSAITSRTDPGLGAHHDDSPLPPTPLPGSASIEELLDGITGPRPPPPSSRREGPDGVRVYSAARSVPASQPMPPLEPAVMSPAPPPVNERDALTVPRAPLDPGSVRPIVRRGEERTVYTGRRAAVRNSVVVVLSATAMAAMMMGIMRWKEAHRPPRAALAPIVESPLPPSPEVAPTGPAPTIVIVSPPPAEPTVAAITSSAPIASSAPSASSATKRPPATKHDKPRPQGSLDDLNREISH